MMGRFIVLLVLVVICVAHLTHAVKPACPIPVPPLGWSTWNTFRLQVNESLIRESADAIVNTPLFAAGYNYVLLDDGWTTCLKRSEDNTCLEPGTRDAQSRIVPDPDRFPSGMKALADYVHSKGLKLGIYTAVSATTCGGFVGSLGFEAIDAATFAEWGMDFVKHDTCNTDCGIHDGCLQGSTLAMSNALAASGRPIVYYIDGGNPTSGPRVLNPTQSGVVSPEAKLKLAQTKEEIIWYSWGAERAHMFKSWFDRSDSWYSLMDNAHNQVSLEMFHSCCAYHYPDMMTVGMGGLTEGEGRVEMFLMVALASPIILGADIRSLDPFTTALVTNPNLLRIAQDSACAQASLVRAVDGTETWVRSLSDGSFVAVLVNKDNTTAQSITLHIGNEHNGGDLWPAYFGEQGMDLFDLYTSESLGFFTDDYTVTIPPHDAQIVHMIPVTRHERDANAPRSVVDQRLAEK